MCPNPEKKKAINSHLSSLSYTNKSFFMGLFVTFKPLYTQIYYSCEDFHVFSFLFVLMLHIYNKHLILHQAWHLLDAPKVYFFLKKIFIRQQWMQFIFYGQKSSRFWRFLPQMDRGGGISFYPHHCHHDGQTWRHQSRLLQRNKSIKTNVIDSCWNAHSQCFQSQALK